MGVQSFNELMKMLENDLMKEDGMENGEQESKRTEEKDKMEDKVHPGF